jgi:hypothetical protein
VDAGATVTEREFQTVVVGAARVFGWRVAHFRPARTTHGWRTAMSGDVGFPDLVLARDGRLLFVELKAAAGRTSPAQDRWLETLSTVAAVEVFVWRPCDWDEIVTTLRRVLRQGTCRRSDPRFVKSAPARIS